MRGRSEAEQQHRQQDGGETRRPSPQQSAQSVGKQKIGERKEQRRGQQRGPQIELAAG